MKLINLSAFLNLLKKDLRYKIPDIFRYKYKHACLSRYPLSSSVFHRFNHPYPEWTQTKIGEQIYLKVKNTYV